MNTTELEKCLYIIGYWNHEDETVINKLLNTKTDIITDFLEPFYKELNRNLLIKETTEGKRDLIKYYVFQFGELQGCYKEYSEILFTGSRVGPDKRMVYEHTDKKGVVRKLNKFESYIVCSWTLFDMLFNEIQLCCINYKIDFFKICDELAFSTKYFDSGITLGFKEKLSENSRPQKTETGKKKLTVPQIALIHVYNNIQISRENAGKIAAEYGYKAKNSGEGLYQDYTYYNSTANRKGRPTPCTPKKLKNKIELFEIVTNHLSGNSKQKAIDEINILKTIFDNEYQ